MKLSVKVLPSSSRDAVAGWLGDTLKIKVRAPAEKGKANQAVIALVANTLGLPRDAIAVVSGVTSQKKILEVKNMSESDVLAKLGLFNDTSITRD